MRCSATVLVTTEFCHVRENGLRSDMFMYLWFSNDMVSCLFHMLFTNAAAICMCAHSDEKCKRRRLIWTCQMPAYSNKIKFWIRYYYNATRIVYYPSFGQKMCEREREREWHTNILGCVFFRSVSAHFESNRILGFVNEISWCLNKFLR